MSWMAWTWQTAAFFVCIAVSLVTMIVWEQMRPGGNPRRGVFHLHTTRGDRLFISLLGIAYIFMLLLALTSAHILWGVPMSLAWAYFVFRRV